MTGSTMMSDGKALFIYDFADSEAYYLDGVSFWLPEHLNKKITLEGRLIQFIDGKSVIKDWKILEVFTEIEKLDEKILGHWVATSTQDSLLAIEDFIISGKQVTFEKRKYEDKAYEWGGGAYNGIEFQKDKSFSFLNNVLCSTESSKVSNSGNWHVPINNHIYIKSPGKNFYLKVVSVSKTKMVVVFLKEYKMF